MRILHICPAAARTAPLAPQSLEYLGHQVERITAEEIPGADGSADVAVVDACLDLSLAPRIGTVIAAADLSLPIIVVLSEGGLATASAKWDVTDIILSSAGPAEVEARLRVARDRFRAAGDPAGAARSRGAASAPGLLPSGRNEHGEPMVVVTGALRIDETSFTADLGGRPLDLTYREFSLLKFFAMHPERVFTRDEILLGVWGDDYYGGTRTVDVHVRRLRAKLGKDLENAIHTVRNVGYRFSPDTAGEDDDEESDPGSSAANSSDAGLPTAGSSDAAPTTGTPSRHPDSEEISA
ncbi:winged-helix domain-containing protein [Brevibacterium casei]|uniref:Winged-helix domain-containing protein n=2 Tax=Brevibacterium casei TaxID=33889 RepID=A0A7T2TKD9_9MICO|nr:winged-helix domain-containing protein [Brevibacterium casei]MCT1550666.1 winged-helix domain-containing protein [Brevibacterium casei]MCT1559870.1 winged-helix domain-containing protein [Brevibacterium casei]MCT2206636.1 winged-helix domain-containing protein [Brevibacterium casei]QPS35387.1 winged-helix domain-containing protein [Brevibacterium casei]